MAADYEQYCPISKAAEVLGERWTLLVVRELLVGSRTFNDIARGVPRMSRSMLSKRLRQLEDADLVERLDGAYLPTEACEALRPAVLALGHWSAEWLLQDPTDQECDAQLLMWWAHSRFDTSALPPDRRTVVMFHFTDGGERFWTVIEHSVCSICLSDPGFATDAVVATDGPTMHRIWHGREPIATAIAEGRLRFDGTPAVTRRLRRLLSLDPRAGLLGSGPSPGPRLLR